MGGPGRRAGTQASLSPAAPKDHGDPGLAQGSMTSGVPPNPPRYVVCARAGTLVPGCGLWRGFSGDPLPGAPGLCVPQMCASPRTQTMPTDKDLNPAHTMEATSDSRLPGSTNLRLSLVVFDGGALQSHGMRTPGRCPPRVPSAAQPGPSCGLGRRGRAGSRSGQGRGPRGSSPAFETGPEPEAGGRLPQPCPTPGTWSMPGSCMLSLWAITSSGGRGTKRPQEEAPSSALVLSARPDRWDYSG